MRPTILVAMILSVAGVVPAGRAMADSPAARSSPC
jgi:hypothetical protein